MDYQNPLEFQSLLEKYKSLPVRRNVLEIGSMVGDTLRCWMDHGEWGHMNLVSVDKIVPPNDHRHAIQKAGHEKDWPGYAVERAIRLTVIDGFSQMPETIAKVKQVFSNPRDISAFTEPLDFLFIDGGHDYKTVKADFENYSPLVKPGGLVAFHDMVGIPDVAKYWAEVSEGRDNIEVYSHMPGGWGIGCFTMPDARPVLHIITPCKRPENLNQILKSIVSTRGFELFNVKWWIVLDGSKCSSECVIEAGIDKILSNQILITDPSLQSLAGKGQINFALDQIGDNDTGFVWVLDDDNAVHPDFFDALHDALDRQFRVHAPTAFGYAFGQDTCNGRIRHVSASEMKELGIDQAQFVIRRDFIGADRYVMKYSGDGEFAGRMFAKNPNVWEFIDIPVTYYNKLRPAEA